MKKGIYLLGLGVLLLLCMDLQAKVRLPHFFSSNMVLQRDMPIRVWGKADKNEVISVALNGSVQTAKTGKDGIWRVELPAMKAGGPYDMQIESAEETIGLTNILIGDVWVCSGQSNMEFGLNNVINAGQEIAASTLPDIRLLNVPKNMQSKEQFDLEPCEWTACNPQTSPLFTAVGYFFGKELQPEIGVPVGLIHTSWGGTDIETWTSWETAVKTNDTYKKYAGKDQEKAMGYSMDNIRLYKEALKKDKGLVQKWYVPAYKTKGWKTMAVPKVWEADLANEDGIVWFRKTIDLPAGVTGKKARINLGAVDDEDLTYVNGVKVGEMNFWMPNRSYEIPAGVLKGGNNVIAVRITDTGGLGGILGKAEEVYLEIDGQRYSLAGDWVYKPSVVTSMYKVSGISPNSFSSLLYNGMVHPLIGYGIKGVIWYQGENNAGRAYQYRTLFPAMINDWRQQWGYEFPFYIVQLSSWLKPVNDPNDWKKGWQFCRAAQLACVTEIPNTGIAVTYDIGDEEDIHPKNKYDVGERLALWALAHDYGKEISFSGPLYKTITLEEDRIRVNFNYSEDGLMIGRKEGKKEVEEDKIGKLQGFVIAGEDKVWYWADAKIEGNTVIVSSPFVNKPIAVRYAFSMNPRGANLYNRSGLPASPFRSDCW